MSKRVTPESDFVRQRAARARITKELHDEWQYQANNILCNIGWHVRKYWDEHGLAIWLFTEQKPGRRVKVADSFEKADIVCAWLIAEWERKHRNTRGIGDY